MMKKPMAKVDGKPPQSAPRGNHKYAHPIGFEVALVHITL